MSGPRVWLTMPTYNEAGNVERIVRAALGELERLRARTSIACSSSTTRRLTGPGELADALAAELTPSRCSIARASRGWAGPTWPASSGRCRAGPSW